MITILKDIFLLLWIVFCCLYPIFWLRCYYLDKKDTFERYFAGDLTSNGFTLVSSIFINGKTPKSLHGYKSAVHPASGGSRIATSHGYKIFRTVTIKDQLGGQHELLAAIEFDDRTPFRRFKGVSWTPDISTLSQIKKNNKNP